MPDARSSFTQLWRYGVELSLAVLLTVVPAMFGGALDIAIYTACLATCVSLGCLWLHKRHSRTPFRVPWYGVALLIVTLFTAFQTVPLPPWLLEWLAPESARVLAHVTTDLKMWQPLSLDPPATFLETLKIGSCTVAFLIVHNYAYLNHRRDRLIRIFVSSSLVIFLLGLIGKEVAPEKLQRAMGEWHQFFITTFVCDNHSAIFLTMAGLLGIGLAQGAKDLQCTLTWSVIAALLGAGVFLTLSRGGILAYVLSLGAMVFFFRARVGAFHARVRFYLVLSVTVALAITIAFICQATSILSELSTLLNLDGYSKLHLWQPGLRMVLDHSLVGIGRGAFASGFTRYAPPMSRPGLVYPYVENQYLQLPAEWGIPLGGGIILASAVSYVRWVRHVRRDPRLASIAAIFVALALQNIVDFNLEMLGVVLPASIFAGMLSACRPPRSKETWKQQAIVRTSRRRLCSLLVMASGLLMFCLRGLQIRPLAVRNDMVKHRHLSGVSLPESENHVWIESLIQKHRAYFELYLAAGRAQLMRDPERALKLIKLGIFLYPSNPYARLHKALALRLLGRRLEALAEYRYSVTFGNTRENALRGGLYLCRNSTDLEALLPEQPAVYVAALRVAQKEHVNLIIELTSLATLHFRDNPDILVSVINAYLSVKQDQKAAVLAEKLVQRESSPSHYLLWARTVTTQERIQVLRKGQRNFPKNHNLTVALVSACLSVGNHDEAASIAKELTMRNPSSDNYLLWARTLTLPANRLAILREAWRDHPHDAQVVLALAEEYLRSGSPSIAFSVVNELPRHLLKPVWRSKVYRMIERINRAQGVVVDPLKAVLQSTQKPPP